MLKIVIAIIILFFVEALRQGLTNYGFIVAGSPLEQFVNLTTTIAPGLMLIGFVIYDKATQKSHRVSHRSWRDAR